MRIEAQINVESDEEIILEICAHTKVVGWS